MTTRTSAAAVQIHNYTFLLGKVHGEIGGPTRTIWGYVTGLLALGKNCEISGLGTDADLNASFSSIASARLVSIDGSTARQVRSLLATYTRSDRRSAIVIVGVWHLSFFVIGVAHFFAALLGLKAKRNIILIPTMSLTRYDWSKRSQLKRALRPLVAILLRCINGVVFASSGELVDSAPRSWRRAKVVLHPTISAGHSAIDPAGVRDIDVLFAGRVDRQKDLPLLFEMFAQVEPPSKLHIVGAGDSMYTDEMRRVAASHLISDRIHWHGWKTHSETLKLLQRSRVVVITSLVENFCHVAVEAMVNGCDVVMVDRVMSAADFSSLADVDVVEPDASAMAAKVVERLNLWPSRFESRIASASAVESVCNPQTAARALADFVAG